MQAETNKTEPKSIDMRPFPMADGPTIPWFLAEIIWTHLYRHEQPLERVAERGGFGWAEVAYMYSSPQWRTSIDQRRAAREAVTVALKTLSPAEPVSS